MRRNRHFEKEKEPWMYCVSRNVAIFSELSVKRDARGKIATKNSSALSTISFSEFGENPIFAGSAGQLLLTYADFGKQTIHTCTTYACLFIWLELKIRSDHVAEREISNLLSTVLMFCRDRNIWPQKGTLRFRCHFILLTKRFFIVNSSLLNLLIWWWSQNVR